jgi:hypothetical protein
MGTWTVDGDDSTTTVAAEPGTPVELTLGTLLGDSTITATARLTVEQAEELRTVLGAAIGVAQGELT